MKDIQAYLQKAHRDAVDYAANQQARHRPTEERLFDRLAGTSRSWGQVEHAIEANVKVGHTMKFIAERPSPILMPPRAG